MNVEAENTGLHVEEEPEEAEEETEKLEDEPLEKKKSKRYIRHWGCQGFFISYEFVLSHNPLFSHLRSSHLAYQSVITGIGDETEKAEEEDPEEAEKVEEEPEEIEEKPEELEEEPEELEEEPEEEPAPESETPAAIPHSGIIYSAL